MLLLLPRQRLVCHRSLPGLLERRILGFDKACSALTVLSNISCHESWRCEQV